MTRRERLKRWGKRLLLLGLVLLFLLAAFLLWVRLTCFATPPELDGPKPPLVGLSRTADPDGTLRLGPNWFRPRPGGSLLALEGEPYALGWANATLTAELLEKQERELMATVERFLPSRLARLGVGLLVLVNNRSLPDHVPRALQLEIRGLADARPGDAYAELGPRYHRVLNYHAAHDISHWVWDSAPGCTAFAARGAKAAGGRLLVGRTFDWEAGRHFDDWKLIARVRPAGRHAFLSVSWPGMAGVVTGLNDQRIWCSLNGAHASDRGRIGRPVSLVARQVLEEADDLAEAIAIVEAAPVFVADSWLLADGETGEAAVVEKTPGRTAVRRLEGDLLLQANHFETPALAGDAENQRYLAEGTSRARHARLSELLASAPPLDPPAVAALLRDRRGAAGKPLALGHRGAIDGLIATHVVVADPGAGVIWVSRGPHGLGELEAHAIEGFGSPAAPPIPADPLLATGARERALSVRARVEAARAAAAEGFPLPDATREELRRAVEDEPLEPEALALLGRDAAARGDPEARGLLERALAADPPFLAQRRAIEEALAGLR